MDIIKYDAIYKKQIPELFTNTIHKTCNKDYTKEQLEAWASSNIDYKKWENRLKKTKPYLAILDKKLVGFVEFYEDYIDCFYVHENLKGLEYDFRTTQGFFPFVTNKEPRVVCAMENSIKKVLGVTTKHSIAGGTSVKEVEDLRSVYLDLIKNF